MSSIAKLRQDEVEFCRQHIDYFIDNYIYIEDKDNPVDIVQPFVRWKEQREATASIMAHRLNIVLKARQLGLSWVACAIATWYLLFSGKTIICMSKSEDEAKELIRRIVFMLTWANALFADKKNMPVNWEGIVFESTTLTITVHYPDGTDSRVLGMASGPGAGRSFTADLIIIDEWAFQQYAREIWTAAYPTINSPSGRGKVIGISTIDRGSLFEELFTDPDNGFNKIFIPWYADPRRDEKWYENTKRAMGDLITQEYPATVEEALMVPGGAMFPEVKRAVHETKDEIKGNVRRYCTIDYGLDTLAALFIGIDTLNKEQLYREVEQPNLTISQAAQYLLSVSANEHIDEWLAPDDLWNRRQETGKSAADIFAENGINLTKVNRDLVNGCIAMKEHLVVDNESGQPQFTVLYGCGERFFHCMQRIQKDKNKPTVYAKNPHELTHLVDAFRYFCTWWTSPARKSKEKSDGHKWSDDLIQDWKNASKEMKAYMVKILGEPKL